MLSREELTATVGAYKEHGSIRAAAEALGLGKSAFQQRLKRASQLGLLGYEPVVPGFEIKKISTQQDADGNVTKTFIQQQPEFGEQYAIPDGHIAKGFSTLVDQEGRIIAQWIKTKTDDVVPHMVEALKVVFAERDKAILTSPPHTTDAALCSIYPIADQHNGLLAWSKDAGEDYDLKIGMKRLRDCMRALVSQSPSSTQAVILNLGDWQHTDDQRNMTPGHGNILDVDSRYFKILSSGIRLMKDCIDLALQKHEHVTVRNLPGNHDPHASIALTVALGEFYSDEPRVTIDQDPSDFFYYRFGYTLIGATHGHKMKPPQMAMNMAVTQRKDWGETKFHYFYFGHIHHETVKEVGDVRCESFQTLAARDAWAAGKGFTPGQSLSSITLHKVNGEVGRHRVNLNSYL